MDSENRGVLIIGGGRGGSAMLKVMIGEKLLPVSGVVDARPDAPAFRVARSHGIRTYRTLKEALAECDPCLAFNVTGDVAIDAELRRRHHKGGRCRRHRGVSHLGHGDAYAGDEEKP